MQTAWIYGKLNKDEILKEYAGKTTDTAETVVDNNNNQISVNVIKLPHKLSIEEVSQVFTDFDGSSDIILDLTPYAKHTEVPNYAEIDSSASTSNSLIFYRKDGETKTQLFSVEISGFTQVQADWTQEDTSKESYIKNKPTKLSQFTNDGDGTLNSQFATQAWVQINGGKIDEIQTVDGALQVIDKTVIIPEASEEISGTIYYWKDDDDYWNLSTVNYHPEPVIVIETDPETGAQQYLAETRSYQVLENAFGGETYRM